MASHYFTPRIFFLFLFLFFVSRRSPPPHNYLNIRNIFLIQTWLEMFATPRLECNLSISVSHTVLRFVINFKIMMSPDIHIKHTESIIFNVISLMPVCIPYMQHYTPLLLGWYGDIFYSFWRNIRENIFLSFVRWRRRLRCHFILMTLYSKT